MRATKVYNGFLWHLREEFKKTGKNQSDKATLKRNLKGVAEG
jgi:hypothetical protein